MGSLLLSIVCFASRRIRMVKMKFIFGPLAILFAFTILGATSLHISEHLNADQDCGDNNRYCEPYTCCPGLDNTCCGTADGSVGCCPIKDGVCCSDGINCCWPGFHCTYAGDHMECSITKPVNMTEGVKMVPGFRILN